MYFGGFLNVPTRRPNQFDSRERKVGDRRKCEKEKPDSIRDSPVEA